MLTLLRTNNLIARCAALWLLLGAPSVEAAPAACASVSDPQHAAAIAAAEAWRTARWAKVAARWTTAYVIPPPPPAPLGIGSLPRAREMGAPDTPPKAIAGLASVAALTCTTELAPSGAGFVVHYTARGLRFNEAGQGWSRPLKSSVLHVLDIRRATADAPFNASEQPEARVALIPGMRLALPTAADVANASPRKARSIKTR